MYVDVSPFEAGICAEEDENAEGRAIGDNEGCVVGATGEGSTSVGDGGVGAAGSVKGGSEGGCGPGPDGGTGGGGEPGGTKGGPGGLDGPGNPGGGVGLWGEGDGAGPGAAAPARPQDWTGNEPGGILYLCRAVVRQIESLGTFASKFSVPGQDNKQDKETGAHLIEGYRGRQSHLLTMQALQTALNQVQEMGRESLKLPRWG
ncbi:hypothetical protein C8R43DRAFT_943088 [Mycena crocata]|nr:hypothetical protein C8R43DRAFT_943088 [Mycena crocata]